MMTETTSRDKIERRGVVRERTPSILAIGQSIILATRARLAFWIRLPRRPRRRKRAVCDYRKGKM